MTLHRWTPVDFRCMQRRKEDPPRAGLEVVVGCVQFNRNADCPNNEVKGLREHVRRSREAEVGAGGAPST